MVIPIISGGAVDAKSQIRCGQQTGWIINPLLGGQRVAVAMVDVKPQIRCGEQTGWVISNKVMCDV